jgi:hypothetical protein
MRKLQHTWRWPLSLAAGLLLLILLAEGAARFYPSGELPEAAPRRYPTLFLLPVPEIETAPAEERPEPRRRPRPETPPSLVRDLWRSLTAERAAALLVLPDSATGPSLFLSSRVDALLACDDTTRAHLREAARLLREGLYADFRSWGGFLEHMQKAQSYQARKSSIFNEDWLSEDALR